VSEVVDESLEPDHWGAERYDDWIVQYQAILGLLRAEPCDQTHAWTEMRPDYRTCLWVRDVSLSR